jgi:hypothetical protein
VSAASQPGVVWASASALNWTWQLSPSSQVRRSHIYALHSSSLMIMHSTSAVSSACHTLKRLPLQSGCSCLGGNLCSVVTYLQCNCCSPQAWYNTALCHAIACASRASCPARLVLPALPHVSAAHDPHVAPLTVVPICLMSCACVVNLMHPCFESDDCLCLVLVCMCMQAVTRRLVQWHWPQQPTRLCAQSTAYWKQPSLSQTRGQK